MHNSQHIFIFFSLFKIKAAFRKRLYNISNARLNYLCHKMHFLLEMHRNKRSTYLVTPDLHYDYYFFFLFLRHSNKVFNKLYTSLFFLNLLTVRISLVICNGTEIMYEGKGAPK